MVGDFDHNHPTFELAAYNFIKSEYLYVETNSARVY